jgi:hypothetical protein
MSNNTPTQPVTSPNTDDAKWAAADLERNRLKALPYEQTKEYSRAMEAQIQKQHRTGSTL